MKPTAPASRASFQGSTSLPLGPSATRACRAGIARAAFLPPLSLKAVDPPVLCRLPCTWPGVPRGKGVGGVGGGVWSGVGVVGIGGGGGGGGGGGDGSDEQFVLAGNTFPSVFYLPEPPVDFAPLRDFRRLPDAGDETISPKLALHIRRAYERRELALELHEELRTEPERFPLTATIRDDPEKVGQTIRQFLGVDDDTQQKAARAGRVFDFWRRKMEERDILVFLISGPHYSVELKEMRGFAIARPELPVIVVNGRDYSQGGKAFTLLHELAHIVLGESAISTGAAEDLGASPEEQKSSDFVMP